MARKLGVAGAAVIFLAILALGACGGERSVTLCGADVRGKPIHYRTDDGVQLVGATAGRGNRAVVFANGWTLPSGGASLRTVRVSFQSGISPYGIYCTWLSDSRLARRLIHSGFQLFLFDYRGTGRSGAGRGAAAHRYDLDVTAAVDVARRRGVRDVVLVGGSFGGVIVIVAARELRPRPTAIVTLSASGFDGTNSGRNYGNLDAEPAAKRLDVPLLLIASKHEGAGFVDSRALVAAAAAKTKKLEVIAGSAHSTQLLRHALVGRSIFEFIKKHAAG